MKNSFIIASMALLVFGGCSKDITDDNVNPKQPEAVPAGTLFANAEKELFDYMTSPNVNVNTFRLWAQHWTQTTYTDESNFELTERNINGEVYDRLYARVLRDLLEARMTIDADEFISDDERKIQLAMITVLEVYCYHVLVDIFGDVPYSAALRGAEGGEFLSPAYDDDVTIYKDLAQKLKTASADLGSGGSAGDLAGSDLIFSGNAGNWRAFANSLLLKLAVRMGDYDNATAQGWATDALSGGVINSAEGNVNFPYISSTPNTNPLWEELVQSKRTDFIAANTLADQMNADLDPRRAYYFRNLDSLGNIQGNPYGSGGSYFLFSQPGDMLDDPTLEGELMSYEEVLFLMADAAARGWTGGDPSTYYTQAIEASVKKWTGSDTLDLLFAVNVDYDLLIAGGMSWREVIATQKWVAMYNRGFEAWSTWRLYDAPTMNVAAEAGTVPPTRYNYSVDEYSVNGTNVGTANGGSDNTTDKVFWDVN